MLAHRLKAETSAIHERLEEGLGLGRGDIALRDYLSILVAFRGFLAWFEPAVETALGEADFTRPRRKLGMIDRDLRALKVPSEALPSYRGSFTYASPAAALGGLYVMEGSTLGGQVISRVLRDNLGITPERGGAYFASYGAEIGLMWRRFRERLDRVPDTDGDSVVNAAVATFEALEGWLPVRAAEAAR